MRKNLYAGLLILVFIFILLFIRQIINHKPMNKSPLNISYSDNSDNNVRLPAVAGQFYPVDKEILRKQIEQFLANAGKSSQEEKFPFAFIVPHAGYNYSGSVAAFAYKQLIGQSVKTVILIGNSHYEHFSGVSIFPKGFYKTPLGLVKVDEELAGQLIKSDGLIDYHPEVHYKEHSLEVQLPFLQEVLGDKFKIVPVLFGNVADDFYQKFAQTLFNQIKNRKDVLLIASSDLSHYPSYSKAQELDKATLSAIVSGQVNLLETTLSKLDSIRQNDEQVLTLLCAPEAVKTVMLVAKMKEIYDIQLLKYANSGDASNIKDQVVGYGAVVFWLKKEKLSKNKPDYEENVDNFSQKEQKEMLKLAKLSVEYAIKKGKKIEEEYQPHFSALEKKRGVFVTLRKNSQLRGCIGLVESRLPLYRGVIEMARAAALDDPRFLPVQETELPDLEYEISILSPLKKINNPQEIILGKHGVKIQQGTKSGLFLPQVAEETGWSLEEFLSHLCQDKASLASDCWKDSLTEIYVFTVQIIK